MHTHTLTHAHTHTHSHTHARTLIYTRARAHMHAHKHIRRYTREKLIHTCFYVESDMYNLYIYIHFVIIISLPQLRVSGGGGGVLVDHTRIQYMHTHSLRTQYCVITYMDKYAYKHFMSFNCLAHLKCLYGEWGGVGWGVGLLDHARTTIRVELYQQVPV